MNNILGVDLKIDQNYIAECVKEVVNASMIEALGAKNDIVETIVKELESGNVNLDDAINKYTEAMKLAKYCGEKLNDATKKVNKILTEDNELKEFNAE